MRTIVKILSSLAISLIAALAASTVSMHAQSPFSPTRFTVEVVGSNSNDAPQVILIPGLASSRVVYDRETKVLSSAYRLHRIQIAGFAGLPAGPNGKGAILGPVVEELHQYIQSNHLDHPAIIGHSIGGLIALMLADAHPDDAGKLLLIDTLPFYSTLIDPDATAKTIGPDAKFMRDSIESQSPVDFINEQRQVAPRLSTSAEGQKAIVDQSYASNRKVVANALYEDMITDLRSRIGSISTPLTLLYPFATSMGPRHEVDSLYSKAYASMKQARLICIENSRHFIMYDQPVAFHKAVVEFLRAQ